MDYAFSLKAPDALGIGDDTHPGPRASVVPTSETAATIISGTPSGSAYPAPTDLIRCRRLNVVRGRQLKRSAGAFLAKRTFCDAHHGDR